MHRIGAHLAYWILIAPVNATTSTWTPESVPAAWTALRDRWQYTHAARAVLMLTALAALLVSVLVEPSRPDDQARGAGEPEGGYEPTPHSAAEASAHPVDRRLM